MDVEQVRARRFALHNAEWMEMAHGELEQERRGYEEDKVCACVQALRVYRHRLGLSPLTNCPCLQQFFVEQDRQQQMVGMEGGDEYQVGWLVAVLLFILGLTCISVLCVRCLQRLWRGGLVGAS